ncbi:MAG: zinc-dependent alcohol dehydrogenase family protein [Acidobacteria bacterium]|nr:zinc-dependent alcohol dehydrogenase family protein [Acidobacteriota bacterium]
MRAMRMHRVVDLGTCAEPLSLDEVPRPVPGPGEVLLRVGACGVCHTELDEIEGRTPPPRLPVTPGHQVAGVVEALGPGAARFKAGDRGGVAWIHSACGDCDFCREGRENLCAGFRATGRDADGGYAEYMTVPEAYAVRLPDGFTDLEAAPLLCAGAVGYRSLRLAKLCDGQVLGLVGFGASAHLVIQAARHQYPNSPVYVFARSEAERAFALALGAGWAGDIADDPPSKLHAAIDTTPAWTPVVEALRHLERGGRLVINAIRKEAADLGALLSLDYASHLWLEKSVKSVANVTRADAEDFLALAAAIPIRTEVQAFPLEDANRALLEIKQRRIRGAKVLQL